MGSIWKSFYFSKRFAVFQIGEGVLFGEVRNERNKGSSFSSVVKDSLLAPELWRKSLLLHDLLCNTHFIMHLLKL